MTSHSDPIFLGLTQTVHGTLLMWRVPDGGVAVGVLEWVDARKDGPTIVPGGWRVRPMLETDYYAAFADHPVVPFGPPSTP